MKILECSRGQIYDIDFIDPYWVHQANLKTNPEDTEDNIVHVLRFQETKREILFPYNFEWVLLSCIHFLFRLLDVKYIID